jgi:hypothetical protein
MDVKTQQSSSTKYVAITGLTLKVFRMKHTAVADLTHGFEDLYNSNNWIIYTCASCQNCCVLGAIFITCRPDEYRNLRGNPRKILAGILGQYYDPFEKPMTPSFENADAASTLLMAVKKYNFSFTLFKCKPCYSDVFGANLFMRLIHYTLELTMNVVSVCYTVTIDEGLLDQSWNLF